MPKKKIIIVEDNEMNLKLYQYTLKSVDAQYLIAKEGNEAFDLITKEKPDLVILDIQIPGISGIELIKKLRLLDAFKKLKVIAVTAYSMTGDREKILAAGCDDYVSKPIDTRAFPKMIQKYLESQ